MFQIVLFLKKEQHLSGIFNCSAPNPVNNQELMQQLRKVMNRKIGLPSPKLLLEPGAVMIGTETVLVLKSRGVLPERLEQEGYTFKFQTLESALNDILFK
ncbi:DUF1731 domain-containing protein [Peribacillus deserti]|uniref:DUF1731 domain-containing protein n=1 Tax=Peribacillus deserti TaxID=673318 RepID=UPI0026B68759